MGTYLHLFDEEEEQTAHINSAQYREPYFAGVNTTYKAHYNHYNYKKVNFDTYKPMHYVENPSNGKGYIKTDYLWIIRIKNYLFGLQKTGRTFPLIEKEVFRWGKHLTD